MSIDDLINQTVADIVREGNDLVREAAEEVLAACRPVEHVRPVKADRMDEYLRRKAA